MLVVGVAFQCKEAEKMYVVQYLSSEMLWKTWLNIMFIKNVEIISMDII